MKIYSLNYLSYATSDVINLSYAASEMRVELAPEQGPENYIEATYAFMVYTADYITENFLSRNSPVIGRSIMIVPSLDNDLMFEFLNDNILSIPEWGTKVGF